MVAAPPPHVLELADARPGLQRFKVALQVNPYAYIGRQGRQDKWGSADAYNKAMAQAAVDAGIAMVSITDHHTTETDGLAEALLSVGIVVLPGVEITSSSGIHVLGVFPETTVPRTIDDVVAHCDRSPGSDGGDNGKALHEVIERIHEAGGLPIAAHILLPKIGLMAASSGRERADAWKSSLLAAAGLDQDEPKEPAHRKIIEGRDANYRRERPLAIINAADVSAPPHFAKRSTWTWMSMTDPSFRGLRQALMDPESRVKRPSAASLEIATPHIAGVAWEGGRFDGVTLPLHEHLNVLIGGRGAGKSSVIESIRYVFGGDCASERMRETHQNIVTDVIGTATTVHVVIADGDDHYVVSRSAGGQATVHDGQSVVGVLPSKLLPDLRIMGQHEIAETANNDERRTALLRPFLSGGEGVEPAKEIRKRLEESRRKIATATSTIRTLEEQAEELEALTQELSHLQQQGIEQQLGRVTGEDRAIALIDRVTEWLEDAAEAADEHREVANRGPEPLLSNEFIQALPAADELRDLRTALAKAKRRVDKHVTILSQEYQGMLDGVAAAREVRVKSLQDAEAEVQKLLRSRDTRAQSAADAYRRKVRRREQIANVPAQLDKQRRLLESLVRERSGLLDDLDSAVGEHVARMRTAAKRMQRQLRAQAGVLHGSSEPKVEVTYRPVTDASRMAALVDQVITGQRKSITSALARRAEADCDVETGPLGALTGRELVAACRSGPRAVKKLLPGVTDAQAKKVCAVMEDSPDAMLQLEEVQPRDHTALRLDVDGTWRDINRVSIGQQATAVLLVLLASADGPVVIDQAEDDLDNAFVAEAVVPLLRASKQHQQYILSSHNANIPVLGDAELVTVLRSVPPTAADGEPSIEASDQGGLDDADVQRQVEILLEGGRAAFEERRRRYGVNDASF